MTDPRTEFPTDVAAEELLRRAWYELNAIRARDGTPSGVDERYFDELVDALAEAAGGGLPWPSSAATAMIRVMRREAVNDFRSDLTTCYTLLGDALDQIEGDGVPLVDVVRAILAESIDRVTSE